MKSTEPDSIYIEEYNYDLPENKIAKYPLEQRDKSKLLIYRDGDITDTVFSFIPKFIPEDSLMVFNNTKVIQARIYFKKDTGAAIEVFCLDPYSPHDYNLIFQSTQSCSWFCLVGNLKKWKEGTLIKEVRIGDDIINLKADRINVVGNHQIIEFSWDNASYTFADILDYAGELPIPPYLNRSTEEKDKQTYQTVYSKIKGSVAAPTAGLHFTDAVFGDIRRQRIETEEVTLHVGAGTFKPVKSETVGEHEMHSEFISVRKKTIENILNHKGNIIAVGTTSVRTLESLYYIGVILETNPDADILKVSQWQPYNPENNLISKEKALKNILECLDRHASDVLFADTQIMIVPGYEFKIVTGIVTNFHQPKSTLLLLVSAFVKGDWKTIYTHALTQGYRFLSYGDSSLLIR